MLAREMYSLQPVMHRLIHLDRSHQCISMMTAFFSLPLSDSEGLSGERNTRGKMDVYLQRFRPDHYAELLKSHVL